MTDKKALFASIAISIVVIGGALYYKNPRRNPAVPEIPAETATIVDGKQVVDITARGGYSPRVVNAKAGLPTVIRVTTKDTYDCSSSLVIPKIGYSRLLTSNGTEEIAISPEQARGTLNGLCSMGMYSFKINFL